MSVEATSWALHQQLITDPGARAVLFGLANHANHEGRHAFPSISLLCRYTGLGRRSVIGKLKLLVDSGIIRKGNQRVAAAIIDRSDRRPVVYDLCMHLGTEAAVVGDEDTPNDSQQQGADSSPREDEKRGADIAPREPNGVQNTALRGAGSAPEPSLTKPYSLSGVRESNIFEQAAQSDDDGMPVAGKSHQFPMSLDWVPNPEMFAAQCLRACLPTDTQYAPHQLAKFTAHFADQPHRRHGESAWIAKLVDWVRNDTRRAKTAEQDSPGVRHASRQQPNATRSERDRVAEVLANPDDTSWMEGLFSQGETNFEPCEPGVYENGGDFPTDVEDIVYDREDGHAGEAGGSGFHDAMADAADASEPGCGPGANQGGGQRMATERSASDHDAQAATGGLRDA